MPEAGGHAPRWRWGDAVDELRRRLERGGVLAFPTESSYALGAEPRNRLGVETVYAIKGRERGKPLPVVIADLDQAVALGVAPGLPQLERLRKLWPAPLTAVLPIARPLPASAGGSTLAVRVPAHERLRKLLRDLGFGLTATSANRAGEAPVTDPRELDALLAGHDAVVWDAGSLAGGAPSTLVMWENEELRILRAGAHPAGSLAGDGSPAANHRQSSARKDRQDR